MNDKHSNINAIKDALKQILDEKRFAHTLAVCEVAVMLAERFGADKEKAYLAALLHDCARGFDNEQLLKYCNENNIELDDYMKSDINPVHALAGAHMAIHRFGISDNEILNAIRRHAVGCEDVTLLDKIILVADATEPNRTGADAEEARIAAETNLDKALAPVMRIKSYYLQGRPMHPNGIKMLEKYNPANIVNLVENSPKARPKPAAVGGFSGEACGDFQFDSLYLNGGIDNDL